MKKETQLQTIIRKSGMEPSECRCKECRSQCQLTSCLGTPDDLQKLIDAGHATALDKFTFNSPFIGNERIHMYKIKSQETNTGCHFYQQQDGMCLLHEANLKPTEGMLSHHKRQLKDIKPGGGNSIALLVARTWDTQSYLRIGHQVAIAKFLPNLIPAWEPNTGKLLCKNCQTEVENNLQALAQHSFTDCKAITDKTNPPMPLYSLIETAKNENNPARKHRSKRKTAKD